MRLLLAALFWSVAVGGAAAQPAAAPATQNHGIILGTPISQEAFAREADGKIRHLQSGGLCPAGFPNVAFLRTMMFPSAAAGEDVACDYGRFDPNGAALSKLTIYFVKAPEGVSLDAIFAQYKAEIVGAYPGAKEVPSSLKISAEGSKETRSDYRSIGYTIAAGHTEMIVAIFSGWILKVRATYPSNMIMIREGMAPEDMRIQAFDLQSPYLAFLGAMNSLTKPAAPR